MIIYPHLFIHYLKHKYAAWRSRHHLGLQWIYKRKRLGSLKILWNRSTIPALNGLPLHFIQEKETSLFLSGCTKQFVGSWFPQPGTEPRPLPWKCQVPATGPPENSQTSIFSSYFFPPNLSHFLSNLMHSDPVYLMGQLTYHRTARFQCWKEAFRPLSSLSIFQKWGPQLFKRGECSFFKRRECSFKDESVIILVPFPLDMTNTLTILIQWHTFHGTQTSLSI